MRRGSVWIAAGLLLIAAALGLTAYNLAFAGRAGRASEKALAALMAQLENHSPGPGGEAAAESPAVPETAAPGAVEASRSPEAVSGESGEAARENEEASSPAPGDSLPEGTGADVPGRTEIPDYELVPEMDMPEQLVDGIAYIGVLSMPTIDRYLPVCSSYDMKKLQMAPCRYAGSVYRGGMTVCAHRVSRHFTPLADLKLGDRLYFTDMDGNRFTYEVAEVEILEPTAIEEMTESGWDLTLFTCTVGALTRLTVRCRRVAA